MLDCLNSYTQVFIILTIVYLDKHTVTFSIILFNVNPISNTESYK